MYHLEYRIGYKLNSSVPPIWIPYETMFRLSLKAYFILFSCKEQVIICNLTKKETIQMQFDITKNKLL